MQCLGEPSRAERWLPGGLETFIERPSSGRWAEPC